MYKLKTDQENQEKDMAILTEGRVDYSRVLTLFSEGSRRSRIANKTVLVSYTQQVERVSLLEFYAAHQEAGQKAFYWEKPVENFGLAGVGAAFTVAGEGPSRFEKVKTSWANLLHEALVEKIPVRGTGPVLMGGFSFYSGKESAGPAWNGFGEACLVLPRMQFTYSGDRTYLTLNALLNPGSEPELEVEKLLTLYPVSGSNYAPQTNPVTLQEKGGEVWKGLVSRALEQIEKRAFQKVVIAREVQAVARKPINLLQTLLRLRGGFPEAAIFAVSDGSKTFIGASPERLVELDRGEVRTTALAGSISRGTTEAEDEALGRELINSRKNQAEHAVVVDIIYSGLQQLCARIVKGEPPRLLKLPNVQHLYTPICGRANPGKTIIDFVEALHPTPALGGYPRQAALDFLRKAEPLERGWYGAPLGWLDTDGNGEFIVAIRSALINGKEATLFAGCGIVAGSDPESEYQESRIKLRAMLSALEGQV